MRLKTIAIASTLSGSLLATVALADGVHHPASGDAAKMAYLLAQSSPLLTAARKTAISQDFNGAPLAGKPRLHRLQVASVLCRVRSAGMEEAPTKTHAASTA